MRRLAPFGLCLAVALSIGQPPAAAVERGSITGSVRHGSSGKLLSGVSVTLTGALSDGSEAITLVERSDVHGRYEFRDLPTGEDRFYALDASYDGGLFAGGAVTLPDDTTTPPVIETTLRVWETTTDPNSIVIRRDDIFAVAEEGDVGVIESVTVANVGERAYVGRGAGDGEGSGSSLGFALPPGADQQGVAIVESDLDIPELVPTDFGFAITVAIPPGTTRVTYAYRVEGSGGTSVLTRSALYPILEFTVHATPPLDVLTNRLERIGPTEIGGRDYNRWTTTEDIEAGDPVQIEAVARASTGAALKAGLLVAGVILVLLIAIWLTRLRQRTSRDDQRPPRGDLVDAIADLDLRHSSGDIGEDEWRARRAELKRRLTASRT